MRERSQLLFATFQKTMHDFFFPWYFWLACFTYRFELNLSSNVSSSDSSTEKLPFWGAEKRSFKVTPSSLKYCSETTDTQTIIRGEAGCSLWHIVTPATMNSSLHKNITSCVLLTACKMWHERKFLSDRLQTWGVNCASSINPLIWQSLQSFQMITILQATATCTENLFSPCTSSSCAVDHREYLSLTGLIHFNTDS